jgi:hypothetical protein
MYSKNFPVSPYVNVHGMPMLVLNNLQITPRYATGYTTLFNILGFVQKRTCLKWVTSN